MEGEVRSISTQLYEQGGRIADRYEVVRHIGSGGMAHVYLALDHHANPPEQIAIKVLHREFSQDKNYLQRFVQEVQLMVKVDHPAIVKTYDLGTDGDCFYFTMEYVEGRTLADILDTDSVPIPQAVHVLRQIASGFEAIHKKGIIHRDLKPDNVIITPNGDIKITDFGIARGAKSKLTTKAQRLGSFCYMAPEIWSGQKVTPSVDLYSLGIVLYEMLTNSVPFEDDYPGTMMKLHTEGVVRSTRETNPDVPIWLDQLALELLAKFPIARPRSASEVVQTIDQHAKELGQHPLRHSQTLDAFIPTVIDPPKQDLDSENKSANGRRGKTYVVRLSATRLFNAAQFQSGPSKLRRKATFMIPLPRHAAMVFEFEPPSRDFIYFGVFLASLQVFDGVLTSMGVHRFGLHAEANPMLRNLMQQYGIDVVLFWGKVFAVIVVVLMTMMAKRAKWIKNMIGFLSCLYLYAAIVPWLFLINLHTLRFPHHGQSSDPQSQPEEVMPRSSVHREHHFSEVEVDAGE